MELRFPPLFCLASQCCAPRRPVRPSPSSFLRLSVSLSIAVVSLRLHHHFPPRHSSPSSSFIRYPSSVVVSRFRSPPPLGPCSSFRAMFIFFPGLARLTSRIQSYTPYTHHNESVLVSPDMSLLSPLDSVQSRSAPIRHLLPSAVANTFFASCFCGMRGPKR